MIARVDNQTLTALDKKIKACQDGRICNENNKKPCVLTKSAKQHKTKVGQSQKDRPQVAHTVTRPQQSAVRPHANKPQKGQVYGNERQQNYHAPSRYGDKPHYYANSHVPAKPSSSVQNMPTRFDFDKEPIELGPEEEDVFDKEDGPEEQDLPPGPLEALSELVSGEPEPDAIGHGGETRSLVHGGDGDGIGGLSSAYSCSSYM